MPDREWELRIYDIIEAAKRIQVFTENYTYEKFASDRKTVDAVIRNIEIIGEAANHIPPEIIDANPDIPWRLMTDMRNEMIHEYFGVDSEIVWVTTQQDLPSVIPQLEALINPENS